MKPITPRPKIPEASHDRIHPPPCDRAISAPDRFRKAFENMRKDSGYSA
jgi:hypothetical protein